jgi:hypothetical protein
VKRNIIALNKDLSLPFENDVGKSYYQDSLTNKYPGSKNRLVEPAESKAPKTPQVVIEFSQPTLLMPQKVVVKTPRPRRLPAIQPSAKILPITGKNGLPILAQVDKLKNLPNMSFSLDIFRR